MYEKKTNANQYENLSCCNSSAFASVTTNTVYYSFTALEKLGEEIGNGSEQAQQFILYLYKISPAYLCIFVQLENPAYHRVYELPAGAESKGNSRTCLHQFSLMFFRQELILGWNITELYWKQRFVLVHLKDAKHVGFAVV